MKAYEADLTDDSRDEENGEEESDSCLGILLASKNHGLGGSLQRHTLSLSWKINTHYWTVFIACYSSGTCLASVLCV